MYLEDSSLQTSYNSVKTKLLLSSLTQLGKTKLLNQPETGKTKLLSSLTTGKTKFVILQQQHCVVMGGNEHRNRVYLAVGSTSSFRTGNSRVSKLIELCHYKILGCKFRYFQAASFTERVT